jgi:hypothetical protein
MKSKTTIKNWLKDNNVSNRLRIALLQYNNLANNFGAVAYMEDINRNILLTCKSMSLKTLKEYENLTL